MANIMSFFKIMITMQLFYAFAITLLAYSVPADAQSYVTSFSDLAEDISLENVSSEVQSSFESQTNIPLIELGALVFYSGNILIDLMLNFAFAIPQMLTLLLSGLLSIFGLDMFIFATMQLFLSVTVMVLYFMALIQLLTGVRSGRLV